jgi:outer membrane receptor protein involved in Fe transport
LQVVGPRRARRARSVLLSLGGWILGGAALGGAVARAAEDPGGAMPSDIEAYSLEELLDKVVTSSGGEAEERALAFGTVVVIDRAAIARRGLRSVAEALADVPGLYVLDDHLLPALSVRGVNGGLRASTRLVKVMINGMPVDFRPDLSAFIGPEYIPMQLVERIEVVLGPLSALYGANAFIATVNVITAVPKRSSGALAFHANQVEGHAGGGLSGTAALVGEDLGALFGFAFDHTDRSGLAVSRTFAGQNAEPQRYDALLAGRSGGDTARPLSLFLRAWAGRPEGDRGQLALQGGFQRLDRGAEFQVNSAMTGRSRVAVDNLWSHLRYERRFSERHELSADLGFSGGRPADKTRLYLLNNDTAYFQPQFGYRALSYGAAFTTKPGGERLTLRAGVDGELDWEDVLFYRQTFLEPIGARRAGDRLDLIGASDPREQLVSGIGLSLQVRSRPAPEALPGLRLNANVRADRMRYGDISFPLQPSWRLGAVYQWSEKVVTKLVGGRAFQTPSPVLMFAKGGYGIGNNVVGNVDLQAIDLARPLRPQTIAGAEAALSLRPTAESHLDLSLYHQELNDAITFTPAGTDFVAQNETSRRSVGLAASGEVRAGRFLAAGSFAATFRFDGGRLGRQAPELFPRYKGALELAADLPEAYLRLGAHLRRVGERGASQSNILRNNLVSYSLPGYTLLDLTVGSTDLAWPTSTSQLRLLFSVRNALGARYSEPGFAGLDIPSLGRSYLATVQQAF